MGNTKTLINFLIKLQNATICKKSSFEEINPSLKIIQILNLLVNIGYIRSYSIETHQKIPKVIIILKYQVDGKALFSRIKIISKPGTVSHLTNKQIRLHFKNFAGSLIFSTSQGFLTFDEILQKNLGGILLYKFYY